MLIGVLFAVVFHSLLSETLHAFRVHSALTISYSVSPKAISLSTTSLFGQAGTKTVTLGYVRALEQALPF